MYRGNTNLFICLLCIYTIHHDNEICGSRRIFCRSIGHLLSFFFYSLPVLIAFV